MAPVEHQRFYLDDNGREISSQIVITEPGATRRVKLHPCELTIRCHPKDSSGSVTIKGDVGEIIATVLWDQNEEEIPTIQLKRPIKISDGQKLIIRSKLTRRNVEIWHRSP